MNRDVVDRVSACDWPSIEGSLDAVGFAPLGSILTPADCDALAALYGDDSRFRSRIDMERFRFGVGEYKYFAAPLPPLIELLRRELYARLAPTANRWAARAGHAASAGRPGGGGPAFPATLDDFLARCHAAGQRRPTPLLLSYAAGGYNCLHQDIYGELAFPLQVVFVLSPSEAYRGGELLLVEQRPRAQSRGHVVAIAQGAGVAFATRERPVEGTRGAYRVVMRHGVGTIAAGRRMSLGIIFHDAK
ncbi:MAG: 2OG-Fe(II) oxygenase [Betaproteobacteria bacterium]